VQDPIANRLTPLWRSLLALAWICGFFAYAAIWQASTQLGIGTWWIGPRAQPTSLLVRLLPSAITLGVVVLTAYGLRRLPALGVGAAALLLVGALPDFPRSTSLALTEVTVALTLMATSAAAFTGLARPRQIATVADPTLAATWEQTDTAPATSIGNPSDGDR